MIVSFFSNYLTHHQIPFCETMYRRKGIEFHFISTMPMEEERKNGGWETDSSFPYELKSYFSAEEEKHAFELAKISDVVIMGSAPEKFVGYRMKYAKNKLTFRYTERIYKKGRWRVLSPRGAIMRFKTFFRYINKPIYALCASAYTAGDLALLGSYLGRCYKWGYFPETKRYKDVEEIIGKKKKNSLLWTARFIDWKHPETAVAVAERLKSDGYNFQLNMIGVGALKESIKKQIIKKGLQNEIRLLGAMSPNEVREHMEQSEIFLFTSDRNEGWGAVLNEAMNSGCAVVANREIGSVPFLLKDNENGIIYKGNNVEKIYKKVKLLIDNEKERKEIGANAYKTITEEWNAEAAADRMIKLIESGKYKNNGMFKDGPCSRAEI